jgi:ketosteroid isomerase-like protein
MKDATSPSSEELIKPMSTTIVPRSKRLSGMIHFTSPRDNRINRETYFEKCCKNADTITGFTFINLVAEGERVFVTYEGQGSTGKPFRNTEILTVHDGKIVEVEVYFGWSVPHEAPAGGFVA